MPSMNLRLAQQIPVQRQSHRIVYYQLQKLRKPRTLGPPEDERSFTESQEAAHRGEKHAPATHSMVGDEPLSYEHWDRGKEKNKASNGEIVRLRTGRLTPATFSEAAETLTGSGSTRNPEKD